MTNLASEPGTASPPSVPGYEVSELLGLGASGQVWRARRALLSGAVTTDVAIKIVRAGEAADRELAVLRSVRHPHVVELRDVVVVDGGALALVTDVLDGGSLASVVKARGRLAPGEVVTVVAPLAAAVAALHADGVAHGDLAPGNVLFDGGGKPYLADLGTVRVTGEPRREIYGTAGFVDPVVLAGEAATNASDVYGLGAIAWFALCGEPPPAPAFRRSLAEVLTELDGAAPPDSWADLMDVLERAVDPDPEQRPGPGECARLLHGAAIAQPVWRPGGAPVDGGLTHRIRVAAAQDVEGPRHRRQRARRGVAVRSASRVLRFRAGALRPVVVGVLTVSAAALVMLAVVGLSRPGDGERLATSAVAEQVSPPEPSSARTLPAKDALRVVRGLAAARASAFADPGQVQGGETAPGSPARAQEVAALRSLSERGLSYQGLRLTVRSAEVVASEPGNATVDVIVDESGYEVVRASGGTVAAVSAVPGRRSRLELVATDDGWRVRQATHS